MLGISGGSAGGTVNPFDPSVVVDATTVLDAGSGANDWVGRASVKRRSDGVLVMAYYKGENHATNVGALHIRFSDDDAATWTAEDTKLGGGAVSGFPMNPSTVTAGEDAGEPWLYLCPNGDLLIHMWRVDYGVTANGTYQSRSTDGGESWSTSEQIDFVGAVGDTLIFATDDDFVFDGTIYAGCRAYSNAVPDSCKNTFISSDNNGVTWTVGADLSDFTTDTIEVGMEYVGNSTIVAVLRSLNNSNTYATRSTDMGATWAALANVNSTIGVSGRHRIYTRSHLQGLAGWWKDPVLFMVGHQTITPGSSMPRRNCIWVSPDRGTTWDGPHYIAAQADDGGYGDMFWTGGNTYSVISYSGTLTAASLVQYDLSVELAP